MASFFGAIPGLGVAGGLILMDQTGWGQDFLAGTAIIFLPQLWFVIRGTRTAQVSGAATLAIARYSLVAVGFALWFAWRPDAELIATLAGSTTTLVLVAAAIAKVQRQTTTH